MQRFKNILYFADKATEADAALEKAKRLAKQNQARLTLVDVLDHLDKGAQHLPKRDVPLKQQLMERRKTELEYLALSEESLEVEVQVLDGIPFVEVIRLVNRLGIDLLIKSSRPAEGFYSALLGSNDMHLLRKCPCPVWINKPNQNQAYRTVLAAVDPEADGCSQCEQTIMDLATSMADAEGARLSVVHAWRVYGESTLSSPWLGYSDDELHDMTEKTKQQHQQQLDQLLGGYGLSSQNNNVHLVQGEAAESILHTGNQLNADLIVMGTVGRTGIPGFLIGNTAEEVLQNTRASILTIKPKGFESPVY